MKIQSILLLISFNLGVYSQVGNLSFLDINNVRAAISDSENLFHSENVNGFEFPINSGKNLIFTAGFWFIAKDSSGAIKGFAESVDSQGTGGVDLYPGTLSSQQNVSAMPVYAKINKAEIDSFINDYNNGSIDSALYPNIFNWPAHGDTTQGYDYYLAPFYDLNSDGNYNPNNGDYPCIKGDQAIFMIKNDKGNHNQSSLEEAHVELHYLLYAYNDGSNDNSIFVDFTLINKGSTEYRDGFLGFFYDAEIGTSTNDYYGTFSNANVSYFYNAENTDAIYGDTLPVLAFKSLKSDISSSFSFTSGAFPFNADPIFPANYFNYLSGFYTDGSPYFDSNNNALNFIYDAMEPGIDIGSEMYLQNQPGDRRGITSIYIDSLAIGEKRKESFVLSAVIPSITNDNDAGFPEIYDVLNAAEQRYQSDLNGCFDQFDLSAHNTSFTPLELILFPNPVSNILKVKSNLTLGKVTVYDVKMKKVESIKVVDNQVDVSQLPQGIYFIEFENIGMYKIVKR